MRISPARLHAIRNLVDVAILAERLGLSAAARGRRQRFRCPRCRGTHTTLASRSNLARCFRCRTSFNPIDIVLAARACTFREAVAYLEPMLTAPRRPVVGPRSLYLSQHHR